jgi:hypothetical protein
MALKSLSTADLQRELERRQRGGDRLLTKRNKVLAQLAEIDKELAALGISGGKVPAAAGRPAVPGAPGGKRRRAKNDMSLPDALVQACEVGAVVSPAEASDLVLANGFKTTSARFNMMVSNALAKDKRFKRIGRGQYERVG